MEIPQLRSSHGTTDDFLCHHHDLGRLRRRNGPVRHAGLGLYRLAGDPQHMASDGKYCQHPFYVLFTIDCLPDHIGGTGVTCDNLRGSDMESSILGPVVALAAWTMIIWIWMYATRIPAMNRAGIDGTKIVGSSSGALRDALIAKGEEKASWVADNYNHLHEAPTVFYAICLTLALVGQGDNLNATIAWVYVGLRVAHSLVQILSNRVVIRFALFGLSSLALMILVIHAVMSVLLH